MFVAVSFFDTVSYKLRLVGSWLCCTWQMELNKKFKYGLIQNGWENQKWKSNQIYTRKNGKVICTLRQTYFWWKSIIFPFQISAVRIWRNVQHVRQDIDAPFNMHIDRFVWILMKALVAVDENQYTVYSNIAVHERAHFRWYIFFHFCTLSFQHFSIFYMTTIKEKYVYVYAMNDPLKIHRVSIVFSWFVFFNDIFHRFIHRISVAAHSAFRAIWIAYASTFLIVGLNWLGEISCSKRKIVFMFCCFIVVYHFTLHCFLCMSSSFVLSKINCRANCVYSYIRFGLVWFGF